uniref:NR LBD domain-containing protein n=1 Tax=Acrobeloides nanus TaxID=290746 RepID=A0A914CIB8_9BILA
MVVHNRCVSEKTKDIMRKRREWAVARLFEHYEQIGLKEPMVRLGEIILLLPEIEEVINLHTSDFQVAKLFQFCDMSGYWYERLCYSNEDQE